jgi:hypothetical protein
MAEIGLGLEDLIENFEKQMVSNEFVLLLTIIVICPTSG